ncbi:MAG TPA: hypothetical protein VN634_12980 [Candidatus Limnocylindrales bacterium]|nr:hypothetical protein [Candidatus Limnocylindrales bacterium]
MSMNEHATPASSGDDAPRSAGLDFAMRMVLLNATVVCGLWSVIFFDIPGADRLVPAMFLSLIVLCLIQFAVGAFSLPRASGMVAMLTAPLFFGAGVIPGLAWGRPLRVRGRQLFPELRKGSDWTRGARPDASGLDQATRTALEALWLHDAQKEHASVPAFSRISWMLAAVGAPSELMEWAHRAALQEIEHTRLCFALAAGYGGRSHSVEAMPDLLLGGLDSKADPIVTLASESLTDGCQLEDFNADVACECSLACEEPITGAVLEQIAREERSHADFSWALLDWLLERHPDRVRPAIQKALCGLERIERPTTVNGDSLRLVAKADATMLRKHGRLTDERVGELWGIRLELTRQRLSELLDRRLAA